MKYLQAIAFSFIFVTAAVAQTSTLAGRWEGEIQLPRRPVVVLVDFDARQGSLGLTGSTVFPVSLLKSDGEEVHFELRLAKETVSFRVVKAVEGLWDPAMAWIEGEMQEVRSR